MALLPPPARPAALRATVDANPVYSTRIPANAHYRTDPGFYERSAAAHALMLGAVRHVDNLRKSNLVLVQEYHRWAYCQQTSLHHAPWRAFIDPPFTPGTQAFLAMHRDVAVPVPGAVMAAADVEITAWLATDPAYTEVDRKNLRGWKMACLKVCLKDMALERLVRVLEGLAKDETASWDNPHDLKPGLLSRI